MTPKDNDKYSGEERRIEVRSTRPFGLVRYFSITSAAAFVGAVAFITTLHLWTSKEDLVSLAEIETLGLGRSVSTSAWPEISRFLEKTAGLDDDALRTRPETRQIHDILQRVTMGLPVLKIKIYSLTGRTLFSTDTREIGEDRSGNPGFLAAAKQRTPASKLSRKGSITAFSGVLFDRDVVETYLPVHGPSGAIEGVFEFYTDISRTVGNIHGRMRQLVLSLMAVFLLLYGLLYLIVRRADRILHQQSLDIDFKSAAIAAKNTELEREISERKQFEGRLKGAVQSLQEAFAYFDADDRLVLFNDEYRRLHKALADILKPGTRFEELIHAAIERGTIPDAVGRERDYIRERMARRRNPKGPVLRTLADGTHYIVNESRTPDGGIVVAENDVTERHRAEQALKLSESRLRGAIESLQEGFALCDAEDRVVAVNDVYKSLNPFARETVEKHGTFEDMLRANVASGAIADAAGREEEFIRERMERHRNPRGQILRRFSDGRWLLIRENRTPEGGTAITFTDITDLKRAEEALREGERALRAVIDSVPAMVNAKDRDSRYLFMNEYQAKLYGIAPQEAVGKTASDILGSEYGRYTQAIDAEVLATDRGKFNYEENWVDPTGTTHVLLTAKVPLTDDAGNRNGIVTVALDITDRKQAEEGLRASEERFKDIAESASDWFWETGPDLRCTFVSDQFHEQTGFHPEDIIDKTLREFVGLEMVNENPEQWQAHDETLKEHLPLQNFEYSQRNADRLRQHVRVSGKPIFDDAGAFLGYRGVATDITEYRRTERELAHHKRMESLGSLAGGIAHNLNNLLQPILILGPLTSDALEKSSVEYQNLEFINQAAVRAKDLVDRILAFSREKSYQLKSTDIYDIVREELNLIHSIVPSSITINENLDENTGTVVVDALQAQMVLMNIIANAIDAMEGKPGTLDISLARACVGSSARDAVPTLKDGEYAKLTISDNGRGMDEQTLGRIFDPFFTTKPPGKGTGLGLSTAFGIVHKHGGAIRAASTPGKGTTFDVYLPLNGGEGR